MRRNAALFAILAVLTFGSTNAFADGLEPPEPTRAANSQVNGLEPPEPSGPNGLEPPEPTSMGLLEWINRLAQAVVGSRA